MGCRNIYLESINIINAFKEHAPQIYETLKQGQGHYNTTSERDFIEQNYPLTEKISVDFAIMEKAGNIYTLPADIAWSDLGTWNSLHAFMQKDSNNNVVINKNGDLINSHDNIIKVPKDKKVIVKDLQGYIVIDENGTLLIYPKNKEQEIKHLNRS